jgi:hypothetical protein
MFLGGVKNNLDSRSAPSFPPPPNRLNQLYMSYLSPPAAISFTWMDLFTQELFRGERDSRSETMEILIVLGSNFHIYAENYFIKYLSKKKKGAQSSPK